MYFLQLMFEAVPVEVSDPVRLYRGFIAVDKIEQLPGTSCKGFCTFSAGFCDWDNDQDDDFEWSLVRNIHDLLKLCYENNFTFFRKLSQKLFQEMLVHMLANKRT